MIDSALFHQGQGLLHCKGSCGRQTRGAPRDGRFPRAAEIGSSGSGPHKCTGSNSAEQHANIGVTPGLKIEVRQLH